MPLGVDGHRLIGHVRDRKFFNCSTAVDSNCVSQWLLPGGAEYTYEAGKAVPLSECKASCECTGNQGYYFSDLSYKSNLTLLKPYNYGESYGQVRLYLPRLLLVHISFIN